MSEASFDRDDEIAIIGLSGRFPGARNTDEFWQNLQGGVESITFFSDDELLAAGIDLALLNHPNYVKAVAMLEDIDVFDAAFFGYSPREAEIMDPQHRIFLECAWEALENAGYDPNRYEGWIGVYGGVSNSSYLWFNLASNPGLIEGRGPLQVGLGNDKDYFATRVSYKLNLNGPSMTVQTACSSSLVAIHLASQSLLAGECTIALAGGASISLLHKQGYLFQEGELVSPDGHCRSFDAKAQGSTKGAGVGVVVLKLLSNALHDGDHIHAVIKGSAVNNDGSLKIGFTAPSIERQAQVIAEALAEANVDAETITYLEAHGSATPLGDPIEIAALTRTFRDSTDLKGFCALGSVKTNIGHLDAAAGVTGFIKTVLALEHQMLPPSLHFTQPNPNIDFANSPFYVNTQLRPWQPVGVPRRAGVSSFGIGGTNAHVILEEAPIAQPPTKSRPWQLVLLSAKTPSALETATANLINHLQCNPQHDLANIAYTYQVGRKEFPHRRMLVCHDLQDALRELAARDTRRVFTHFQPTGKPPIVFMFPGLGDHYIDMARELYELEEVFREHVDHCCDILLPLLGLDLRDVLYPSKELTDETIQKHGSIDDSSHDMKLHFQAMLSHSRKAANGAEQKLYQTVLSHTSLFVIEYALAQLWMAWGIYPQAMIGYSLGEYVAACLAGVFSLEDALALVARRAQLIEGLPESAMLAISLAPEQVASYLPERVSLAAINAPAMCIVSGPTEEVELLAKRLATNSIAQRRVQTSHGLHSSLMEPIVEDLKELLKAIDLNPPQIPYLSNVTGTWITEQEATDPDYWAIHLCRTVRFADEVHELLQEQDRILLEIGPGQTLGSLVMQNASSANQTATVLPSLRPTYEQRSDLAFLLTTLGKLWLLGISVDWSGFYGKERRERVPLPTYPFERQRYWIEAQRQRYEASNGHATLHEVQAVNTVAADLPFSLHPRPNNVLNAYGEPRTEIERRLASLWQDLLGIEQIGIHDTFFELGGNSLLSIQLVTRLRQTFQVPIPLDYPFKAPMLEDLATVIAAMLPEEGGASLEKEASQLANGQHDNVNAPLDKEIIPRRTEHHPALLSFTQQHIWHFERLHPESSVYNIPFGDFVLQGPLDMAALRRSLDEIVQRHEILRTTFTEIGGQTVQIVAPTLTFPLSIMQLQQLAEVQQEVEARRLALVELLRPFDLAHGPLIRACLLCLNEEKHVLLLNAHHIVCDGWSRGVFLRELSVLYAAFTKGQPSPLPALPIQYADFALWQQQRFQGNVLQTQVDYWQQQLNAAPHNLNWPANHERPPAIKSYRGKHQFLSLPKPLVDQLRTLSQQEDATLFMVLLTTITILLYRITRQEDILVGTPISNRYKAEMEKLIGCFVNTLVIRTRMSDNPDFRALLRQVRKATLEAYAHQTLPFEKLVEELHVPIDKQNTPLIQAMFIMHNVPLPELAFEDLALNSLDIANEVVLYNLTLIVLDLNKEQDLQVFLRYQCDLFDDAAIVQMLSDWVTLLETIVAHPDQHMIGLLDNNVAKEG